MTGKHLIALKPVAGVGRWWNFKKSIGRKQFGGMNAGQYIWGLWRFCVRRLRKEIKKSGTYLSICESYRDENGRVLRDLGNASDYSGEEPGHIGRQPIELAKGPAAGPENIAELSRHNYGFPLVLHQCATQRSQIEIPQLDT